MSDDDENHMTGSLSAIVIAAVHLPRGAGERGTWQPVAGSQFQSGAAVTCDCGRYVRLDNHVINRRGEVLPRVQCAECGWSEFVVLDGWAP